MAALTPSSPPLRGTPVVQTKEFLAAVADHGLVKQARHPGPGAAPESPVRNPPPVRAAEGLHAPVDDCAAVTQRSWSTLLTPAWSEGHRPEGVRSAGVSPTRLLVSAVMLPRKST